MRQYTVVLCVKAYSDTGDEGDILASAIDNVEDGLIDNWDIVDGDGNMRMYVVTKAKDSDIYYIHQEGYAWIPVLSSFTKSKAEATKMAAAYSGFPTVKEYSEARRRHKK